MKKTILSITLIAAASPLFAQEPVVVGGASYAAYPPAYKARTEEHAGFQASMMMTRKIYADETDRDGNPRPIPTNDWWTDLLNNQFSGAMWSYPAMVTTAAEGVTVAYPTYWNENGTEVKPSSSLTVGGLKFTASQARAIDWHDWDVEVALPAERNGNAVIKATLAHGTPFTWFEFEDVTPEITFSASPEIMQQNAGGMLLGVAGDLYGLYYPASAVASFSEGALRLAGADWLSVGLLQSEDDFAGYAPYATSVVRSTEVSWAYDEQASRLTTRWQVKAENLRDPGAATPVMQGFLPHAWKHAIAPTLPLNGISYLTPRGTMKMAAADNGLFEYAYRFSGMLPWYAAPAEGDTPQHGYIADRMTELMNAYASQGGFGDDTYWGGKGLTQMALNMTFAKETGQTEIYETARRKLRDAFVDWLTYSPGENTKFFSYYPRWGGMLGFDVSYDSDAFNDHHFHYGYFIYAGALLCMEDEAFRNGYGEMLKMIAKDYANYDRTDTRFPFLRTLDPWAGHSYAGGLGDHGNDNGNGQESSSEAMQGWGGVYLLGVALGDKDLRDAGIFGWLTESRGTAEYWFDRDHIHPGKEHNYDYSLYTSPYNTNLTSKGIGWWTWFSGDPLWMHSIQWMPVSPCLDYLSEDLDFVKWDYETMRASTAYSWFENNGGEAPLADQSVGNVVLSYMERYDPEGAAEVFDRAWDMGLGIARGIDTGHISYYVIHSHLTYGDHDFVVTADCPTANAYHKADGTMTYMVYNPEERTRRVTFYRNGVAEKVVNAPARRLTAFSAEAQPASVKILSENGFIIPPGGTAELQAILFDQYGVELEPANVKWSVSGNGVSIDADGGLMVEVSAVRGTSVTVTAKVAGISATVEISVNDTPQTVSAFIAGMPDFVEVGNPVNLALKTIDQYGNMSVPDASWVLTDADGNSVSAENGEIVPATAGRHTITATAGSVSAIATLVVLPQLPDVTANAVATSSSEENVSTKTEYAIDGDPTTRWGSEHSDDQWFMLDLGADYRISSVSITWEAAFAADYDLEVLANGRNPESASGWNTVWSQRGLSAPGLIRHSIAATGRYLRVKCLRRGSAYGYSIIEIGVGGVRADVGSEALAGIEIVAPQIAMEGESVELSVRGFSLAGEVLPSGTPLQWSSTPEGIFSGNRFTPLTFGVHTLNVRCGNLTASKTVLVEESVKLASLKVSPVRISLLTGDECVITVEGMNQFGGVYPVDASTINVAVKDEAGRPVAADVASFNVAEGLFRAMRRGNYIIDFAGMATVEATVRDVAEANLAAGKPARASSVQGGNTPAKVTDLDLQTRWESNQADGEWISIDLEQAYLLDRVVLHWEGAYASAYRVETSMDGERWFSIYETASGNGGVETIALPDVPASQVRLYCLKRATAWGNSLYEIEVYGKSRFDAANSGVKPAVDALTFDLGNGSVDGSVKVSHPQGLTLFTTVTLSLGGIQLPGAATGVGSEVSFSFSGLKTGTYRLTATVEDPFGNTAAESRDLEMNFSSAGINLALGKPVEATSSENEITLRGELAVDGDLDTRWGSIFNDDESLTVDLLDIYLVDNVRIYWNTPAFATDYSVETSLDGVEYRPAINRHDWTGGTDDSHFTPVATRYVRVTGHRRATPYGTSINELEVYGNDYLSGIDGLEDDSSSQDAFYRRYGLTEDAVVDIYTIDGVLLHSRTPFGEALTRLLSGFYLVTDGFIPRKLHL